MPDAPINPGGRDSMPAYMSQGPINPTESIRDMLCNLQGNILKPHGREHAVHIFLQFKAGVDPASVRKWMREFADRCVTSAEQQRIDAEQHRPSSDSPERDTREKLFGNLFLSATGYGALGYSMEEIKRKFVIDQKERDQHLAILRFHEGMEAHSPLLNDPNPKTWEWAYRDRKIDAMILLAHAEEAHLLDQICIVLSEVAAVADVLTVELGHRLRNASGDSVEPFGYRTGISEPLFFQDSTQTAPTIWDPSASLDLVLLPDPFVKTSNGGAATNCFGSYLVFRKLEQNIRGFHQCIRELAMQLGCRYEKAQALVLGRFRDGTPLSLCAEAGMSRPKIEDNDFDYRGDRGSDRCPFQAHIRRINPRHESAAHRKEVEIEEEIVEAERRHRIARRGIPYGTLPKDYLSSTSLDDYPIDQLPKRGVGILFMCFQRSLSNQFGYLQTVWANSETRSPGTQAFVGVDPIIGQPSADQHVALTANQHVTLGGDKLPVKPLWPKKGGELHPFTFQGFVTLKDGEFLFAPSRHFLLNL